MRDWILGLQKAAIEHREGVSADDWREVEREVGSEAPAELRDLYAHLNGATFASGVVLHPVTVSGDPRGLAAQSRSGNGGLPPMGSWRFGRQDGEHLAAIRKRDLGEWAHAASGPRPAWLESLGEEGWVFAGLDENTRTARFYESLEQLLTARIPPAVAEDFGDQTLARARTLVEAAVTELGALTAKGVEKFVVETATPVERTVTARGGAVRSESTSKEKPAPAKRARPGAKKARVGAKKSGARTGKKARPAVKKARVGPKKSRAGTKKKSRPTTRKARAGAKKTRAGTKRKARPAARKVRASRSRAKNRPARRAK